MAEITLPSAGRGRRSAEAEARQRAEIKAFCAAIEEINSSLDFRVSSRGWCYLLEEHGLGKGDFDRAQRLLNQCRKAGDLSLDVCAEDSTRAPINLRGADASLNICTIDDEVESALADIESARQDAIDSAGIGYAPAGFWHDQVFYVEALVEKIDLKELFKGVCDRFRVPLANNRGWPDINSRAAMMRRFAEMERAGKTCVLLYCGDHDPAGLLIAESLRAMFDDLAEAVGWSPDNLVIERFGLNADFIEANRLSWIEGLETGSGRRLDDPRHHDHDKPYVQDYLSQFGARKVEANALVTRAEAGRQLCHAAITRYVDADAPRRYLETCREAQSEIKERVLARLGEDLE